MSLESIDQLFKKDADSGVRAAVSRSGELKVAMEEHRDDGVPNDRAQQV